MPLTIKTVPRLVGCSAIFEDRGVEPPPNGVPVLNRLYPVYRRGMEEFETSLRNLIEYSSHHNAKYQSKYVRHHHSRYTQDVRCTTKCSIFPSNAILARETLPFSRCIPLGRAKLQILQCKIFR